MNKSLIMKFQLLSCEQKGEEAVFFLIASVD